MSLPKQITKHSLRTIILLLISLIILSCSTDKDDKWTIMVYMAADNNLSEQAIQDIIEMEQAQVSSDINVIVQLDPRYGFSDPQARRYKIKHNKADYIASPVVKYLGEIDSGDYLNLVDFVNWSIAKYPAQKYALFIWSHGTGWTRNDVTRGLCPDKSEISVAQGHLRRAFSMFSQQMEILLIDACLMFTIEVLTEVYDRTGYIIGSENLIPYEGFPYGEILDNWTNHPAVLSKSIVDLYIQSHLPGGSQNPSGLTRKVTASAMDTRKLPELLEQLQQFVAKRTDNDYLEYVDEARTECFNFHPAKTEVDIKEFFSHLYDVVDNGSQQELLTILQTIDELFIAQSSLNLPANTGTATIWFPEYYEYYSGSKDLYANLRFAQQTNWLSFLEWWFSNRL